MYDNNTCPVFPYGPEAPTGRASGGPVTAKQLYVVGEEGPEWFIPSTSGTIIPNDTVPAAPTPMTLPVAAGGTVIHTHYHSYNIQGSVVTEREIAEMVTMYQRRRISMANTS